MESCPSSSPRADDQSPSEVSNEQKKDSSTSGEENDKLTTKDDDVRTDISRSSSDQVSLLSLNNSLCHQMPSRTAEPCETFNPHVVVESVGEQNKVQPGPFNGSPSVAVAEDNIVFRNRRGGTLPALPSSRKAQTLSRLVKGTSMEFKGQLKSLEASSFSSTVGCGAEPAKMSLVFEMNLDTSSFTSSSLPVELQKAGEGGKSNISETRRSSTSSQTSQDSTRSLPISALKLFGSPKFVKKFTGHRTKSESKIFSKSCKEAPEPLEGHSPSPRFLAPPQHKVPSAKPIQSSKSDSERRFLGSPKLARAIYRAMQHHKKTPSEEIGNSAVAKRLSSSSQPIAVSASNIALLQQIRISSIPSHPEVDDDDDNKVSTSSAKSDGSAYESSSSLAACSSSSSDKLSQTSDVVSRSVALSADTSESVHGSLRTSRKPAMGISMIGKQRRSSSQSSDSRSSHSHHYHPYATTSQATQTDIGKN